MGTRKEEAPLSRSFHPAEASSSAVGCACRHEEIRLIYSPKCLGPFHPSFSDPFIAATKKKFVNLKNKFYDSQENAFNKDEFYVHNSGRIRLSNAA